MTKVNDEPGCIFYGWTVNDDKSKMMCREIYVDGEAARDHFPKAVAVVGKILQSGAVSLDAFNVLGSATDLAIAKPEADKLGCVYWELYGEDWKKVMQVAEKVTSSKSFCTFQPSFKILDMAKAEAGLKKATEDTKAEAGCLFYGWYISGDKLFCREGYESGAAVDKHLKENALPVVGPMLEAGALSLAGVELHGPESEWAACKETIDSLGGKYFDVYDSWSKFEKLGKLA